MSPPHWNTGRTRPSTSQLEMPLMVSTFHSHKWHNSHPHLSKFLWRNSLSLPPSILDFSWCFMNKIRWLEERGNALWTLFILVVNTTIHITAYIVLTPVWHWAHIAPKAIGSVFHHCYKLVRGTTFTSVGFWLS